MFPCNYYWAITGLNYFKGTCDVISVTMAMYKVHAQKRPLIVHYLEN